MSRIFFVKNFFDILFGKKYFLRTEDIELLRKINPDTDEKTDRFFKAVSNMTALGLIATGIPILLYVYGWLHADLRYQKWACWIGMSFVLNLWVTYALKILTHRVRPYIKYPDLNEKALENTPSFPSGHSSVAFQTATAVILVCPCWQMAIPAYLWASTIAYSRMYLGVHYPTDVLVGIVLGLFSAWVTHLL
jgi:membrane-associated phospholipid phosphatase